MKTPLRALRRAMVTALAGPLVRQGYSATGARLWVRETYRDWRQPAGSAAFVRRAHAAGFTSAVFTTGVRTGVDRSAPLSQREYHGLRPLNERHRWSTNRIVTARTVPGLQELLPERLVVATRSSPVDAPTLLQTDHEEQTDAEDSALALLRMHGLVRVQSLRWGRGHGIVLQAAPDGFVLDGRLWAEGDLESVLIDRLGGSRWIVSRHLGDLDAPLVRLYVRKDADGSARVVDAGLLVFDGEADAARGGAAHTNLRIDRVSGLFLTDSAATDRQQVRRFADIVSDVERVFSHPSARFGFLAVDVRADRTRHELVDILTAPDHPHGRLFDPAADELLRALYVERAPDRAALAARRAAGARVNAQRLRLVRRIRGFRLRASGFTGPAARSWVWMLQRDRRAPEHSRAQRVQAREWGFTPEQVVSMGITEQTRDGLISPRDYLYAQPLNGKYEKWIRDRVSASMVFAPFGEHFDTVHYQLFRRGGLLHVIPISREALESGTSLEAIGALIRSQGSLVLTGASWRSETKVLVEHRRDEFVIDGNPCTPEEFREVLSTFVGTGSSVLVAPTAPSAADESTRVLDVVMMNPDGAHPQVAEAMTIVAEQPAEGGRGGTSASVARIDSRTGRWDEAHAKIDGRVRALTHDPETGAPYSGAVPGWDDVVGALTRMCEFAPQLRFVQFTLVVGPAGMRVARMSAVPRWNPILPFLPHTVEFLRQVVDEKRALWHRLPVRVARGMHNAKLKIRRDFAAAFFPRGLLPYQSVRWPGDIRRDLVQRNGIPLQKKLWAYRHGYLSYRLPQYGITADNRHRFISDFEYRWLRHINEGYKYWLEDKVSIKYVAADFAEYLPGYYFYTTRSGSRNHVVPMMDCPEGYGSDYADVLRLAREKGVLALKPDEGSHGDGFYRLDWDGERFALNGRPTTAEAVIAVLSSPANRYLITEFIDMHPALAAIYPHSVNTIRLIVFKKDGITPELGNAYLRIGSSASGFVDNTSAGGMLAQIDVETGRFGDAKTLSNGRVQACPRHPDTGVLIEGLIPHWELVKREVLRMAERFSQLEYLGFDVAVTESGFTVPEINRFPDFPRIDRFTPQTIDYLLMKLDQKKRRFGYDRRHPRSLVSLPRRSGG